MNKIKMESKKSVGSILNKLQKNNKKNKTY